MTAPSRVPVTLRALMILCLYRAAAATIVGYPIARTLGSLGPTALPDGDVSLFAPSGMQLLEALRFGARAIPASVESGSIVAIVLATVGLFPLAVALTALENPRATRGQLSSAAADRLPSFLFLSGATLLSQAVLAMTTALVVTGVSGLTDSFRNERTADLVPLLLGVIGLLAVLAVGVVQDVARAAVIRHGVRGIDSIRIAGTTLVATPRAVFGAFAGPMVATAFVVAAAAALTSACDVSRPGAWRIASVALVHQLAVVAIVALRLRALGAALTLVDPHGSTTSSADTTEGPQMASGEHPV